MAGRGIITDPGTLARLIREDARREGFDACAIAPAALAPDIAGDLAAFVAQGRHATMDWMAETLERRSSPQALWPEARSVIMLAMNYGPEDDPLALLGEADKAAISVYARHRDYHDVIKGKLKAMAGRLAARSGHEVKVFVDTAPVMEKPLAMRAGIGWQGKHTNLVSRELGSWLFLGAIFTSAELPADVPETDHCGTCSACLDACPTEAFTGPWRIDAARCISYLTIEHKGPVPHAFRPLMGNRIYGCDDCLAVCPWNKFARAASEAKLKAREDLRAPEIAHLLTLDDAAFRTMFSGSPVKRIGRDRFIRNALIAAGNSGNASLRVPVEGLLADASPLVRGAAVWALHRLGADMAVLTAQHAACETDGDVLDEWTRALGGDEETGR
ncbi:MAG: tRNA epoxyqueuosine(34) reductase QueG [Brucellaceae bacterium]|nr:tRNA epoxyqueuosine(34) reductase QueG [Brucellaceae bacterium]